MCVHRMQSSFIIHNIYQDIVYKVIKEKAYSDGSGVGQVGLIW